MTALEQLRSDCRAAEHVRQEQREQIHADMQRRADEVVAMLPGLLQTAIPEGMKDWPRTLLAGFMLEYVEGREARLHKAEVEGLISREAQVIDRIEQGHDETGVLRDLVHEVRAGLAAENEQEVAAIPARAGRFADYVSSHMGMRFKRGGLTALRNAVAGHFQALADAPMPYVLEAERELGRLQLAYADEVEAARGLASIPRI